MNFWHSKKIKKLISMSFETLITTLTWDEYGLNWLWGWCEVVLVLYSGHKNTSISPVLLFIYIFCYVKNKHFNKKYIFTEVYWAVNGKW